MVVISILDQAARHVRNIDPYVPGRGSGVRSGKLSSNELYIGVSPQVRDAVAACVDTAHMYLSQGALVDAIARFTYADRRRIVPTSGSDELCFLLGALLLEPGDTVVLGRPCYRIDEIVGFIAQANPHYVPLVNGAHDLEAMAEASQDARIVWLPSPHNPSGVTVAPDALDRFLDAVPESCLVVLDEAYRDFADPALRPQVNRLMALHPNLVVQRTLSKAFGLAGLRVGYGLGHPQLINTLNSIRSPFNLNAAALAAAVSALDDRAWYRLAVSSTRAERRRLEQFLSDHDYSFWPSQANFVTVHVGSRARDICARLADLGIQIRDGTDLGLPGSVRISLGAPATMAVVREVLREESLSHD